MMIGLKNASIKQKLIVIQTITAFIVVLVCCVFFVVNDIKTFKDAAVRKMYSLARIVGESAVSTLLFIDQDAASQILMKLNKEPDILEAAILDNNGKLFAKYARTKPDIDAIKDITNEKEIAADFSGNKLTVSYKIYQENEFLGTVVLRAALNDLHKIISGYIKVAGMILFAALIASLIIGAFLQRSIPHRLLSLVSKTKEVAETGNYSLRVADNGNDEIGILSQGFNNMLDRIEKMDTYLKETNIALKDYSRNLEQSNRELEEFAYISSHDMKSPITSLNGMLTLMEQKNVVREEHRNLFLMAKNSARQMQKTINALNEIIAFRKTLKIEKENIDLHEALEDVKLRIYDSILSSGAIINADFSACTHVNYPVAHLKSIFQNLLTNAIKYKQEGKPPVIDIRTSIDKNFVVLEVKDQGMGIDMKMYKDKLFGLFQRFHTHIEGVGIGLHMIHSIIESYGGKIYIDSEVNKGTTFKIYLSNVPF
ncbi:HAMP domain-containing protein [Niastella caeni]|uniref:histidine kinase n=1 Tax=Niastella caeni TaxID=2569763 RepID=A0A4S8HGJ1_9BACT|nr:ATP-binding protein [Niastella caeni]THU34035.1 HAMP domain-containing protein [Niastella caeni]